MSEGGFKQRKTFESAATRYRVLLSKTSDPGRRRMLEEMIQNELAAADAASARAQGEHPNQR
ncbi:MAG TPA: hypothetical protein VGJ09_03575 [Bryobacteraceae bacterium]|jgi:hypothetical protein